MCSSQPSRVNSQSSVLDAQARADLAAGRWRRARDAFKELRKCDRATFEPLLIEANIGLARSMLDKGLVSEAQQVHAYLKTFAPAEIVAALSTEITARSGGPTKPAAHALEVLACASLPSADQRCLTGRRVSWSRTNRSSSSKRASVSLH